MIYCIINNILENGGIKMGKGTEYGKPKKVTRPRMYFTFSIWACIAFGIFFAYGMISEYIKSINLGRIKAEGIVAIPLITLVLSLVIVGIGVFSLKMAKNIYFYKDGFVVGKDGEKNLYKDLHYFFVPGMQPNTFQSIFYQTADGNYSNIPGNLYPRKGFNRLQEDVVKVTYPLAMENINNGGVEEFPFLAPRKTFFALGRKKVSEKAKKAISEADKIKITKEHMSIADEVYRWDQYKISGRAGNIVVAGLNGEKVVRLPKLRVDRPNLLEALIGTLSTRS